MKFSKIRSIETVLKEYGMTSGAPNPSEYGKTSPVAKAVDAAKKGVQIQQKQQAVTPPPQPSADQIKINPQAAQPVEKKPGHQLKQNEIIRDLKSGQPVLRVVSPKGQGQDKNKVTVIDNFGRMINLDPQMEYNVDVYESGRHKKKIKLRSKIKKLARKGLKEANQDLFEINFNRREVAKAGLDAPVKCGFEAETFFYGIEDSGSGEYIDDMSIADVEYEFGDLPDSAYEDYQEWIREKAMDEYLPDLIDQWIEDNRDEDYYIDEFMNSGDGPTMDAVEKYKKEMKEDDPEEYQNRQEDGWDDDNWARDYINLEYDYEYQDYLRDYASEDDDLMQEAIDECEGDNSMDEWVSEVHYSISSMLDDYGYDYSRAEGSVEGVADELYNNWIVDNSRFDGYPDTGEYGSTSNPGGWSVETDSSIDPDEGAAAELISPVFSSPRQMLNEMKSLFEWSDGEFGTNNTTGLHVTMSWNGKKKEPNKLKMALLLGDEYLLKEFGRLRNSYTKSQYKNVLRHAEGMRQGDYDSFLKLQAELEKGISRDKFSSIHFKQAEDSDTGNELIEFRIAGGSDYNTMYEKVVKAVVRYGTIMKAGYEEDAFRKDYIQAISRLLRKSQEIDPEKAKEFDEIDSPLLDAAKEIASKQDYFDILKTIENSLYHMEKYQELTEPDADKKWEKSIDDYREGTGRDPSWMGESINEDEITGYIEPDSLAPSKRAPEELEKAQKYFGRAVAMLAKNIADGNARQMPKAKHIGIFRKFAKQFGFNEKELEKILMTSIDDANYERDDREETDRGKLERLKTGATALFKKELIDTPDFFDMRNFDPLADGLWQFLQSEDSKDNRVLDELSLLIQAVNPKLDKEEIHKALKSFTKTRQKNDMYRHLHSSGYAVDVVFFKDGMITDNNAVKELNNFLQKYQGYDHPTSRTHHMNRRSDDHYATVFQMNVIQKMRTRLNTLDDIERKEPEKAKEIKKKLLKIGIEFVEALKPIDFEDDPSKDELGQRGSREEGEQALASDRYLTGWNNRLDRIVKLDAEIDDPSDRTYRFRPTYDEYVIGAINIGKYFSYKDIDGPIQNARVREVLKPRFEAIKKFMKEYDKIWQAEGFANMAKEIKDKRTLDRRNTDFEKNYRDSSKAVFNIPDHSFVYFDKEFIDTLTDKNYSDRQAYLENYLDHFNEKINDGKVFVIPAAHWSQAYDALNGLDLIKTMESVNNYFHSWRKSGYQRLLQKFYRQYNITFYDLMNEDGKFKKADGGDYSELQNLGIEITRIGDSRAGTPGQDYLIDPEDLKNPISDEPIDRGSALLWDKEDKERVLAQFKAFDWSVYPKEMKPLVAKEIENSIRGRGFYSFKVALETILDKIQKGELDIRLRNEDNPSGMAKAAGVDAMDFYNASSSEVADKTNWSNLTDYLGIERGVNDQGVNLLKRVYDQYDSDHNWRPENPEAIGVERWAGAVKAAYKYIKDGYNVSAGNYFRKNQDGSDGDNVSDIYSRDTGSRSPSRSPAGTPSKRFNWGVSEQDYEDMRTKYYQFDAMMRNGIQNYIMRPDVNRLVSFLKNPDNDEEFKKAVLKRMIDDVHYNGVGGPNDFQGALARGRMELQNNESVFDKFDKLPLQEKLNLLDKSNVLEKWIKKKSIKI